MKCGEFETQSVCFTDALGDSRPLVAHYEYGVNATGGMTLMSTRYTEVDGFTVVDTSTGTVAIGACPLPDVTYTISRGTGPDSAASPYRSVSFTAISNDCTINGQAVPAGFSWTVSGEGAASVGTQTDVDGTDYIFTVVV